MTVGKSPSGMVGFSIVWFGQIVSVLATSMSGFALTIWMYQKTQSVTAMGGVQVAFLLPFLLLSPIAGVMVDRYNRKLMMMLSDLTGGLGTLFILTLFAINKLEFWHLYIAAALNGIGNTFQWPAYSATISTMISKEQYGRANGMMSIMEAGPGIVAPILAGALLPFINLNGILLIDVATFLFAISTILFVHIPQPPKTEEGEKSRGNLLEESLYGFKYIFSRPSLIGLQMIFFFGNLFATMSFSLFAPMILARSAQNSLTLGTVDSIGAIGSVIGAVIMSVWGGFKKRKVHGVILGWALAGISSTFLGFGQTLLVWAIANAMTGLFIPLVNTSNQTIWQTKVPPDVQGRVFSVRRLIAWFTNPIAPIIAGTLADFVLEPAMKSHNAFSQFFGGFVGTGPGAGMALLLVFCGFGGALAGLSGYFIPTIYNAETILPDYDTKPPSEAQP